MSLTGVEMGKTSSKVRDKRFVPDVPDGVEAGDKRFVPDVPDGGKGRENEFKGQGQKVCP